MPDAAPHDRKHLARERRRPDVYDADISSTEFSRLVRQQQAEESPERNEYASGVRQTAKASDRSWQAWWAGTASKKVDTSGDDAPEQPASASPSQPSVASTWAPKVGSRVSARWRASELRPIHRTYLATSWYTGTVTVLHPDGSVNIWYDDGDVEEGVLPWFVKPARDPPARTPSPSPAQALARFKVGDLIESKFGNDPREHWFRGKITRVHSNGHADVQYEDGDKEWKKPPSRLRFRRADEVEKKTKKDDPSASASSPRVQQQIRTCVTTTLKNTAMNMITDYEATFCLHLSPDEATSVRRDPTSMHDRKLEVSLLQPLGIDTTVSATIFWVERKLDELIFTLDVGDLTLYAALPDHDGTPHASRSACRLLPRTGSERKRAYAQEQQRQASDGAAASASASDDVDGGLHDEDSLRAFINARRATLIQPILTREAFEELMDAAQLATYQKGKDRGTFGRETIMMLSEEEGALGDFFTDVLRMVDDLGIPNGHLISLFANFNHGVGPIDTDPNTTQPAAPMSKKARKQVHAGSTMWHVDTPKHGPPGKPNTGRILLYYMMNGEGGLEARARGLDGVEIEIPVPRGCGIYLTNDVLTDTGGDQVIEHAHGKNGLCLSIVIDVALPQMPASASPAEIDAAAAAQPYLPFDQHLEPWAPETLFLGTTNFCSMWTPGSTKKMAKAWIRGSKRGKGRPRLVSSRNANAIIAKMSEKEIKEMASLQAKKISALGTFEARMAAGATEEEIEETRVLLRAAGKKSSFEERRAAGATDAEIEETRKALSKASTEWWASLSEVEREAFNQARGQAISDGFADRSEEDEAARAQRISEGHHSRSDEEQLQVSLNNAAAAQRRAKAKAEAKGETFVAKLSLTSQPKAQAFLKKCLEEKPDRNDYLALQPLIPWQKQHPDGSITDEKGWPEYNPVMNWFGQQRRKAKLAAAAAARAAETLE